jgi:hypothetical protein
MRPPWFGMKQAELWRGAWESVAITINASRAQTEQQINCTAERMLGRFRRRAQERKGRTLAGHGAWVVWPLHKVPMKLTKIQRKVLKFYAQHRTTPPRVASVLRSFAVPWLILAMLAGASTWFIWAGWPLVTWLFMGACAGAFLRDIGRIQIFFRTWPVLHASLNWQRVQELLSADEKVA